MGTSFARVAQNEMSNFLLLAGLYAVAFLSVAMGALLSADTLAGEISSGTIQTIVTKPLRRSDVVLGKWLAFAGLLGLYLLLMSGGAVLSVYLQSGYLPRNLLAGLSLIYLEALLVMTISLACSSAMPALATGGMVFGLYGLAFIGGWIEQIGAIFHNQTAVQVGIVTSLLFPTEAIWRRAAFEMQSATGSGPANDTVCDSLRPKPVNGRLCSAVPADCPGSSSGSFNTGICSRVFPLHRDEGCQVSLLSGLDGRIALPHVSPLSADWYPCSETDVQSDRTTASSTGFDGWSWKPVAPPWWRKLALLGTHPGQHGGYPPCGNGGKAFPCNGDSPRSSSAGR